MAALSLIGFGERSVAFDTSRLIAIRSIGSSRLLLGDGERSLSYDLSLS